MPFKDQVEYLTSLTVSDTAELTQFLQDGVNDVTTRCIAINPSMIEGFLRKSAEQTSNGFDVGTGKIVSVVREAGVANDWRECTKISIGMQSRAADSNSLYFSSKYNPSYFIEQDTEVSVLPDPAGSAVNGFLVYYVNGTPIGESSGAALDYNDSDIKYFPKDKVYLVVIYAGIRVLGAAMGAKTIAAQSLTPVLPDALTVPNFTITPTVSSLPSYTKLISSYDPGAPTDLSSVHPFSQTVTDISAFTGITAVPPDSPALTPMAFTGVGADASATAAVATAATAVIISDSSSHVTSLADVGEGVVTLPEAPTYLPPVPPDKPSFDASITDIESITDTIAASITDEDIELVSAKAQQVQAYQIELASKAQQYQVEISAYQAETVDAVNEFNEANVLYQAGIQKAMSDAQQDNTMILQTLQKNLTIAQADANASNTIEQFNKSSINTIEQANKAATNTIEQANKAAAMQNAITDMQEIVHKNDFYIKEWQQGVTAYQAEVGTETQEYQTKLSKYSQEIQKELTIWQQERQGEIQEHAQKISRFQSIVTDELNDFNAELQTYQAEVQVLLAEAQYEQQAEHAAGLQQYQAEVTSYGAEVNAAIQEYQNNLQADQAEYTWLQDQYTRLKADYDAAFSILAGPKQQEARARA